MSLRDVERCLEVLVWFYDHMDMLKPLMMEKDDDDRIDADDEESDEENEEGFEVCVYYFINIIKRNTQWRLRS